MSLERQQLIQLKVTLMECFHAEGELANFLTKCVERYGTVLTLEENLKAGELVKRLSNLIDKIRASDERYHSGDSDDNVPKPRMHNA